MKVSDHEVSEPRLAAPWHCATAAEVSPVTRSIGGHLAGRDFVFVNCALFDFEGPSSAALKVLAYWGL